MSRKYSDFDKRMKRYEASSDIMLTRRMPVVLRLDGNHFRTFTRGFKKPFDEILVKTMQETMLDLCKEIPGTVFGYTQSDEITLVLIDYQTLTSDAWFDYRVEKMCSIASSKATRFFNKHFMENVDAVYGRRELTPEEYKQFMIYARKYWSADFDCRAFNVPKEDVCNAVLWRQKDAEKNSVQALAQSLYKQKEISGIKNDNLQNKMFTEKGVNWNDLPTPYKRGSACKKNGRTWELDLDMPIISQNRAYVENTFIHYGV